MSEDNVFKIILASITSFIGYILYGIKRNNTQHDRHSKKLNEHDHRITASEERMKYVIEKLDDVLSLGQDLKDSNKIILRTLARNSRSKKS